MNTVSFLRQFKIGPFAIFDLAVSYLGIYLIAPFLVWVFEKIHIKTTVATWLWLTIPIGVLFHIAFNQNTPLNRMILDLHGNYLVKIVLLIMLFLGLRNITIIK